MILTSSFVNFRNLYSEKIFFLDFKFYCLGGTFDIFYGEGNI